jgi:hypothetical protein
VADKTTPLVLAALGRAAAAVEPLPLHGSRSRPGLFPSTAPGKLAAQRCREEGYLAVAEAADSPSSGPAGASAMTTKLPPLCVVITDKGLAYLLAQVNPRSVLEDFVRALEARRGELSGLTAAASRLQVWHDTFKAHVEKVLGQLPVGEHTNGFPADRKVLFRQFQAQPPQPPAEPTLEPALLAELRRWQESGASEDCPLPHLFRQLKTAAIGQFHDALRRLHDAGTLYLHPWTGPLHELPEPPFALLVGHEIAYYASLRQG